MARVPDMPRAGARGQPRAAVQLLRDAGVHARLLHAGMAAGDGP